MNIDLPSATAFSPPAIIEPVGRLGGSSVGPRPRLPLESRSSSIDQQARLSALSATISVGAEIEARIRLLRIESYAEGIAISERSLADFRSFQRERSPSKRPAIFVTDAGNIRAVWKTGEEQISLQFLGNREVQFVIFATRPRSSSINRLAGNIGIDNVPSFARTAGVERLLSA